MVLSVLVAGCVRLLVGVLTTPLVQPQEGGTPGGLRGVAAARPRGNELCEAVNTHLLI